jgi:hypothetical protein
MYLHLFVNTCGLPHLRQRDPDLVLIQDRLDLKVSVVAGALDLDRQHTLPAAGA